MNRVRVLVSRIIVLVVAAMSLTSTASEERPTRILVGWAAGGATDLVARYMARQLAEVLGQQFVVENFPGAGGNIAADMTAKSPGDGKTLVFLTSAHAINATLYKNLPFEPVEGFQPVAMVGSMTQILVANPKLPYASVKELISAAKANPGGITYASAGSGSSSHLSMEQLAAIAGISLHHVPYKGTSQYLPDLMAGRVLPMALPALAAATVGTTTL